MTRTVQPGRGRSPRGDHGLAALEWLLIVAAVGGLAALAVVLVNHSVGETGDRVSNPNPRVVAAMVAAEEIMSDADRDAAQQPDPAKTYRPWSDYYTFKCQQLGILYADAAIKMEPLFMVAPGGNPSVALTDAVDDAIIATAPANTYSTLEVPDPGEAVAHCRVTLK